MAYEVGASLNIRNVQNLTPLTLAAKLAKTGMFFHILNIEREIYWQIGATTCAAYPLGQADTIDTETGLISKDSALNLVVFGVRCEQLCNNKVPENHTTYLVPEQSRLMPWLYLEYPDHNQFRKVRFSKLYLLS